jgi:hypothetical protein
MAQRKPILELKADCDPAEFIQWKLGQTYVGGRVVKNDAPTMDGASIEAVIYCIHACELFSNFCCVLLGAAKDNRNFWDHNMLTYCLEKQH